MASSLVERIQERYLDDDEPTGGDAMISSFLSSSPTKLPCDLHLVVLNHKAIDHIGDVARFATLVRAVNEVDLAWNAISSWRDVGLMLQHLPLLRIFNISHNTLSSEIDESLIPQCHLLDTLILNGTNLPISTLRKFVSRMSGLKELHLSQNNFDEAYFDSQCSSSEEGKENDGPVSESVSLIHLNRCSISRWSDAVKMLGLFPRRETVFLCENPLREIKEQKQVDGSEHPTSTIRMMNLSKTEIADWSSIENIERWPKLVDLRINNIPLLDEYSEEERLHLVVGRLDNLQLLNGSSITEQQRDTSERYFIRYYEEKKTRPKKFDALLAKHGKLEKLVKIDLSPATHAKVKVRCDENGYSSEISLRLSRTVAQLMKHLEKFVGIPYERMRLFYVAYCDDVEGGFGPTELRFHKQVLRTLHIEDGASFEVQSKAQPSRKRAQARSTSESN